MHLIDQKWGLFKGLNFHYDIDLLYDLLIIKI